MLTEPTIEKLHTLRLGCYRARRMRAASELPIQVFEGRSGSLRPLPIMDVDWAMTPGLS